MEDFEGGGVGEGGGEGGSGPIVEGWGGGRGCVRDGRRGRERDSVVDRGAKRGRVWGSMVGVVRSVK